MFLINKALVARSRVLDDEHLAAANVPGRGRARDDDVGGLRAGGGVRRTQDEQGGVDGGSHYGGGGVHVT